MEPFDFELSTERLDTLVKVVPRGELDIGTAERLWRCLEELRQRGDSVLLDLSELTFIDSTGLRTLLQAREAAEDGIWSLAMVRARGDALLTLRQSGTEAMFPFVGETGEG